MKKLIFILTLILNTSLILATSQQPDILYYKDQRLLVSTGWGHPSPLQVYYSQNDIENPFSMLHTANYRGHIAIWEISDDQLFLKEVQIENKTYWPRKFKVKSKSNSSIFRKKVFADWFTGVIEGKKIETKKNKEVKTFYYFYVKHGKIVDIQELQQKDITEIYDSSEKDSLNHELKAKYELLNLNNNYISYYYRLNKKDTIIFEGKGGYLDGNSGLSPVLSYFDNDHLKWPYNWENTDKHGAPFCTWLIKNDSLLLTNIELHTGTGFYSIDKYSVDLVDLFPSRLANNRVFGNWVSGIYIIRYGKNKEQENLSSYFTFKVTEYSFLRLREGIVIEEYTIPSDFDFENIPEETEDGLKKILSELKK